MKGSAAPLSWLSLLVLAAFAWQRWHSPFLRIEAAAPSVHAAAVAAGLQVAEAMAVAELLGLGPERDAAALLTACRRFAALRADLGEPLAAVALAGDAATVQAALTAAAGDRAAALARLQARPEAVAAARFRAMRDRFAGRAAGGSRD